MECRHVAVQKGKQDQNHYFTALKHISIGRSPPSQKISHVFVDEIRPIHLYPVTGALYHTDSGAALHGKFRTEGG